MLRKHFNSSRSRKKGDKGFTLVEMIVAVGLFAVVMLVSVGALLALSGANRKAQALQSVMNNLNVSLDGMVRSIRMGSNYHGADGDDVTCGGTDYSALANCPNGGKLFAFKAFGWNPIDPDQKKDQWIYRFDTGTYCGDLNKTYGRICKSINGGDNYYALTAPEISIDSMKFYVVDTERGCSVTPCNTVQPKVVIVVKGTAGAENVKTKTTFNIQATAVQRLLDL